MATPTHQPPWLGTALGVAAALICAPSDPAALPLWLAGGAALGGLLDAWRAPRRGAGPGPRPYRTSMRFTFAALGRIAAEEGGIPAPRRDDAERLMARLGLSGDARRQAAAWFDAGPSADFPFSALAPACRREFARFSALEDLAIESLCGMAVAAGTPAARERLAVLAALAGCLPERVGALVAELEARRVVARARDTLGVGPEHDVRAVRLAYRRMVALWHPDRLSPDAPAPQRLEAQHHMTALREALETLLATKTPAAETQRAKKPAGAVGDPHRAG